MALPCTSTRSWPATHRTPSVMVPPGWCRMAFVTRSLVSRTATSGSTGARHRSRAARTWRRASATVAGPAASRTGSPGSSVGRGGAIVVMGGPLAGDGPGKASAVRARGAPMRVARQMLLQVAVRDIGQLTYIGPAGHAVRFGRSRLAATACWSGSGRRVRRSVRNKNVLTKSGCRAETFWSAPNPSGLAGEPERPRGAPGAFEAGRWSAVNKERLERYSLTGPENQAAVAAGLAGG